MPKAFTILFLFAALLINGQDKAVYKVLADSLLAKGDTTAVITFFEKELKKYPENEDVLRWLGHMYIGQDNLEAGEKYYRRALAVNPACGNCYINIGIGYAQRKDYKKALELYNQAIATESENANFYELRANLKVYSGDNISALFDYNKAIELAPAKADFLMARAKFNMDRGYGGLALPDVNKAIQLAPEDYQPYYLRTHILYSMGRMGEALESISRAIGIDSTIASLYLGRGAIYSQLKEYDSAFRDYDKAIAIDPADFTPYYNRYLDEYAMENLDAACIDLHKAYTVQQQYDPTNPEGESMAAHINDHCNTSQPSHYYQRGIGAFNLRHFDEAINIYTTGLEKFPGNTLLLQFRGNAHFVLAHYENALTDYRASLMVEQAIREGLASSANYSVYGEDSIAIYVNAFKAETNYTIAEAEFALVHYDHALAAINTAIENAPQLAELNFERYYDLRGCIGIATKEYDKAIADFDKSININKFFYPAYLNRAVAKINLVRPLDMNIRSEISEAVFTPQWVLPVKKTVKKVSENILSASDDCDMALMLAPLSGYAHYIKGHITRMKGVDPCPDFNKAKDLGFEMPADILGACRY